MEIDCTWAFIICRNRLAEIGNRLPLYCLWLKSLGLQIIRNMEKILHLKKNAIQKQMELVVVP